MGLQVGDIVALDSKIGQDMILAVEDKPKFRVQPNLSGKLAVQVTGMLERWGELSGFCHKKKSMLLVGQDGGDLAPDGGASANLNEMEKDALGEIGNISMGSAATALSQLLNQG